MHNYSAKPNGRREGVGSAGVTASEGESEIMEAAEHYARNDVPIFPVWNPTENGGCACLAGLDCSRPAKHPIGFLAPHGLQDATTDLDQIQEWWGQYPEANIGMPTGAWTGVVVLEVDSEKGGIDSLRALIQRYGVLPWTRVVHIEGGALHFYFEHRGTYTRDSAGKMGPGLEFHGDGGYVLLPPSVHAKSRTYARQGAWYGE
jgi:Bifunctional DNA primase/polymerase, N-terminal